MTKNNQLETVPCNFCKEKRYKIIGKFKSNDLIQINKSMHNYNESKIGTSDSHFTVVQCNSCKLAYINPRLSKDDLEKFYEGFYDKKFIGDSVSFENTAYNIVNGAQEIGRIHEIERFIKGGKLFDIGAGPGHFLKIAKNAGWDVYGQDLSLHAAQMAKKDFGIRITNETIEDIPFPDNFFDVITMHSTLEHTRSPMLYLTTVFQKLKPGGLLVFSAPNIRSINFYLAKILQLPYPGFIFEHLYYFRPSIITRMLKDNFEILEMTSYHHSRLLLPLKRGQKKQYKPKNKYTTFLQELSYTKQKSLYIRQRLYEFQMRVLREGLEYHRIGGKLLLGDIMYVFARKKTNV